MLSAALLALVAIQPAAEVRILFLGNSHTSYNNLPSMVESLLESDGSGRKVQVESRMAGFLEDYWKIDEVKRQLASKKWNIAVLQGAKISSSHKYNYNHDGAVEIAKLAKRSGTRPMFFAEWPRKNWKETDYILGIYNQIAKDAGGAEVVKVPVAWDMALAKDPKLSLWTSDGNHALGPGSFLAALTIYFAIAGDERTPTWRPERIDAKTADLFVRCARFAEK